MSTTVISCSVFQYAAAESFPSGAANRFPEKCDQDPEGARKLNVEATQFLAKATITKSILLLYISTDYGKSFRSDNNLFLSNYKIYLERSSLVHMFHHSNFYKKHNVESDNDD